MFISTEEGRTFLYEVMRWRRDVRRFRTDAIPEADVNELVAAACLAPSVGYSQPWRFVRVRSPERRCAVIDHVDNCNERAAEVYAGQRGLAYRALKLHGLREAPEHFAVFCDEKTEVGWKLGCQTMPEMLRYSCVTAIHNLWLTARAKGIGVGWVSILEPSTVMSLLDVPEDWTLIAYLCIGLPDEEGEVPTLEREGWEARLKMDTLYHER